MLTKSFDFIVKENREGKIKGNAAVFGNVDSQGDIIVAGAFDRFLLGKEIVPMMWRHREPIGAWQELSADAKTLAVTGQLAMGVQQAREALELAEMGAVKGLSVGIQVRKDSFDRQRDVRLIEEAELIEVSLTPFPANRFAQITSAKELKTVRDVEQWLRDAMDCSKSEAVAIIATLKSACRRDSDDVHQLREALERRGAFLKT